MGPAGAGLIAGPSSTVGPAGAGLIAGPSSTVGPTGAVPSAVTGPIAGLYSTVGPAGAVPSAVGEPSATMQLAQAGPYSTAAYAPGKCHCLIAAESANDLR